MIYVSDTELGRVKLGGPADLEIDTYPDKTFPGESHLHFPYRRIHAEECSNKRGSDQIGVRC